MQPVLRARMWNEDPPDYVCNAEIMSSLFTVEVIHNGFFCGLGANLSYVSATSDFFDNCDAETWSNLWIDEILQMLGYERDGKLHVYWLFPDKELIDGLVPIVNDADIVKMNNASQQHKTLQLFIDHNNFLRSLRSDVIGITNLSAARASAGACMSGEARASAARASAGACMSGEARTSAARASAGACMSGEARASAARASAGACMSGEARASAARASAGACMSGEARTSAARASAGACMSGEARASAARASASAGMSGAAARASASGIVVEQESESDNDFEFYDSDFDAEDGDDDLFVDNVDKEVNDNNEMVLVEEQEDDVAIDDDDVNLAEKERDKLLCKFKAFNPEVDMDNPTFKLGMAFSSVEEVRKALAAYSIRERRKIRKIKNDQTRLTAVCGQDGCPWMIKAGIDTRRTGGFVITAIVENHICERVWELKALTANYLKNKFMDEFRDNQKMDLATFAAKVQRQFNMCPARWKLGRARKAALLEIHGDEESQFRQLWDYGEELRRSNPGSKFFLGTNSVKEPGNEGVKEHLATMYWSYDACKRGFLAGCRPLICIDGCHIKTKYKGQLLTAVGVDPNDCIFPIAMAMVEVECTSAWEWFLTTLRDDLNITNTSPWTIISDKQKGLINAVKKVFPDAEHRFCVRHMIQNFQKAGHRGETLKNDLWAIARSTNIPNWQKNMDKLKVDSELAFQWVEELVPNTWIKAFFSDFCKCDMLLNNHSEVFNSYILSARENPVLSMLEMLFYKQMQRILSKQREAEKWTGRICPKIKKKLDKSIEWSRPCMVSPGGNHLFSVSSHEVGRTYSVDLKAKTCDCRRWQLTGIPCHHALACARTDNINPESLVHSCYTIDTYNRAYGFNLAPLRGRIFWKKMDGAVVHPPLFTKVMGRPKKNRRKSPEEKIKNGVKVFTKAGVTIHCSLCGRSDHNKRTHQRYMENLRLQQQQQITNEEDEEMDIPEIMQHLVPQNPNPALDPTHVQDSLVYNLGQEERSNIPLSRLRGPLPESVFIVAARDSIPQARSRVTTTTTGRGRGRTRGGASMEEPQEGRRRARGIETGIGPRGKSKKRSAPDGTTTGTTQDPRDDHHQQNQIPDLNVEILLDVSAQELRVTQNAPAVDDI